MTYRMLFGLQKEPFCQELRVKEMLKTPSLLGVQERFHYTVQMGAIAVVTGDVGSGKSSALRFAASELHPSEYRVLAVTATSGSIIELYRQICHGLDIETKSASRALLTKMIRSCLSEHAQKKEKSVLIIDEASLLRLEVFTELHTLLQFEGDSRPLLPLILAGQNNLIDNLTFRQSRAFASRVIARAHLEALTLDETAGYLEHHLRIAGLARSIFSEQAVTAIHQGSGGLLRRANNLARGAMIAAAIEQCPVVSAEHVRIASTEII